MPEEFYDFAESCLILFLAVFLVLHMLVMGTCISNEIGLSLLATGLFMVYNIVKDLAGNNDDEPKLN